MIHLPNTPERPKKSREMGLTMVMDKGLSTIDAEGLMETSSEYIDIIKFGFGTSLLTQNISKKIKLYKKNNIKVYLGGTLFEAYVIRGMFNEYCDLIDKLELDTVEISDGSINLEHNLKCDYIYRLSKKN